MIVLETERLILRKITVDDAEFIFKLVNEPAWLQFIGDRKVYSLDDARNYISTGPVDSYKRFGFGLYLIELKEGIVSVGICGLLKREFLEDVDIGFALLSEYRGHGYALEAASAVMDHGKDSYGLKRIIAITSIDNYSSIRILEKIGMRFEKKIKLSGDEPDVKLYAYNI